MDRQRFLEACEPVDSGSKSGIGTLGEKTLHAVLKRYFEPDAGFHEVKLGGYVADIIGESGVIEIQTRSFDKLRKKLTSFLDVTTVTVVYPVAAVKWLSWIDDAGVVSNKRKSPKKGTPYTAFYELYKIKQLLTHENLRLCIVMLHIEEYRSLDGWSHDKKRGSTRYERIPVDLVDEIWIDGISDYVKLIPENLPGEFTVKDFQKESGLSPRTAGLALNVLYHIQAVQRVGKRGNAFVYRVPSAAAEYTE
jgi:hypothetical protein